MNRARQDAITTEIMEIVGGAEALRQASPTAGDLLVDHVNVDDIFNHARTPPRTARITSAQRSSHDHHQRARAPR